MKDATTQPANFNRIEFWGATTIFVFVIFFFITEGLDSTSASKATSSVLFDQYKVHFEYYENHFFPQLARYTFLFLSFLFLNFIVVPQLLKKEALLRNILLVLLTYAIAGLLFGITDTYHKAYLYGKYNENVAEQIIFQNSFLYALWLMLVFGLYSVMKYVGIYLLVNAEALQSKYKFITREGIVAFVIAMISMYLLLIAGAEEATLVVFGTIAPTGILLYLYSFHSLIPKALTSKRPFLIYMGRTALVMLIAYMPITFLILLFMRDDEAFNLGFLNSVFQMLITAPLSWVLFKRQMKGNEEIYVLKKELGRSNASFDFLRSQINPHFLFNALNTIYGTAIQEKAERTSEGIEKLGDMMRFMLQENMQEKISLAREIDYLKNYISLQRLRTDTNPTIKIETDIEQEVHVIQVAPMLLIPFVENAFKHGISFREPSFIKVTLQIRDKTLYFDVYNSKHERPENDPEKNKNGIGLKNVKQRLQLLYPSKHELIIRDTGKEFFIHLTIQLS